MKKLKKLKEKSISGNTFDYNIKIINYVYKLRKRRNKWKYKIVEYLIIDQTIET